MGGADEENAGPRLGRGILTRDVGKIFSCLVRRGKQEESMANDTGWGLALGASTFEKAHARHREDCLLGRT